MRRWNGWGDDTIGYSLPAAAEVFLREAVGPGVRPQDASLEDLLSQIPESRLPLDARISADPWDRLIHSRGQSLPDWIALRAGRVDRFTDGVARPSTEEDVSWLLRFAAASGARVIPYGGGTSVVGHVNPLPGERPVLTINLRRLSRLHRFDETSLSATFGAGILGPDLEALLRARGFMLGHYPQSFEYSTLGGWIATRSTGQQSLGYGRIEDLFSGGKLVSPAGTLELPAFPASAAGPDLRQLVLGSEGRLGIISEATVRVSPLPDKEEFHAVFFSGLENSMAAVRQISQAGLPLSLLRLSTPMETTTTLTLAGRELLIGALERMLALRSVDQDKCMLLIGFSGGRSIVRMGRRAALGISKDHGGVHVGRTFGAQWQNGRFRTPYLRNTLWEAGYAVDTVETATTWDRVPALLEAMEDALNKAMAAQGEKLHLFTHLSHLYPQGASLYTTYLFRIAPDPDLTLDRWHHLKAAVSKAIVEGRGTISHQHGVGTDHVSYLEAEKGELGMDAIRGLAAGFDREGMMNPGKLFS
jgi:alkyldihydroxyacetonephosphate synthase